MAKSAQPNVQIAKKSYNLLIINHQYYFWKWLCQQANIVRQGLLECHQGAWGVWLFAPVFTPGLVVVLGFSLFTNCVFIGADWHADVALTNSTSGIDRRTDIDRPLGSFSFRLQVTGRKQKYSNTQDQEKRKFLGDVGQMPFSKNRYTKLSSHITR